MRSTPSALARRRLARAAALAALLALAGACATSPADGSDDRRCVRGETARECERSALEPSYEPRPPETRIYTTDYFFPFTRAVSNSTLRPVARLPLFVFTIPIDVAFVPVSAIAGFFPGP